MAAAAMLVAPASAHAITVSGSVAPANTAAGANSNVVINLTFGGGQVKDLTVGLPPGLAADPQATPKCTVAQLNASTATTDGCPANTVVGEVHADATVAGFLPVTADGFLFNLVPQAGEPGRFGIVLRPMGGGLPVVPPIILQSGAALRQSDFGLDTIINMIPNTTIVPGDTTITAQEITLYGTAPGTGKTFARNPTSCTTATTTFTAVPYSGATGTGDATFTPTDCDALPFAPAFSARIDVPNPLDTGAGVGLTTVIEQTPAEAGLRNAKVVVPPDLGVVFAQLLPSEVCDPAQFQAHACPPQSIVGSALATSPYLTSPLTGTVALVNNPGGVVKVGLDLQGELNLLISGQLALDNSTTFTNLPDIPISHFELSFQGGPTALLAVNRDVCKAPAPVFHTEFLGHNGAAQNGNTPATVKGCGPQRDPKVRLKLSGAGSDHPRLKLKVKAASGFDPIKKVALKLPGPLAFAGGAGSSIKATGNGDTLSRKAVHAGGHTLRLNLGSFGTVAAIAKTEGDALVRRGSLPRNLRFRAKVTDLDGTVTSLRVKPKR